MKSEVLLYCREKDEWFDIVIVDRADLFIKVRSQGLLLADQAALVVSMANRYQAVVAPDVTPSYGGIDLLKAIQRQHFHRLWVFPSHIYTGDRQAPKQLGMWRSALVNEGIFAGVNQVDLSWYEECEYIARWMLESEGEYCELCGK